MQELSATGTPSIAPYEAYSRAAENMMRNTMFNVLGTLFLWWLAGVWTFGAKIGFWGAVAVTAVDTVQAVLAAVATLYINVSGERRTGEGWMIAGMVVRLVGCACAVGLLVFLYGKV